MRPTFPLLLAALGLSFPAVAQTCTGLACQQVSCPGGGTTTIKGVVYAPNGVDPLPNVTVYVPNGTVDAFAAGVSCPVVGAPPSGSPLVGTTTATDGSFTIADVPVGANIPLVIVSGRWRRQVVLPGTTACTTNVADASLTRFPKNQTEGDIPRIAVATGSVDQVECVLRKVGLDDSEFTNNNGNGRVVLYGGTGNSTSGGVTIPATGTQSAAQTETDLMSNYATLSQYDVLMLPCQGGAYGKTSAELANLISFANSGGRVYASHYSYSYLSGNGPFSTVANWTGNSKTLADGNATVDTSFVVGATLADWLQLVGATTTKGQMPIYTLRQDLNGVNAPTQSWLTLNTTGNPVMQFVFDTPVGVKTGQCGRVLFNEYHVENGSSHGLTFSNECSNAAMTPQEKLLEYSLFELTDDGGAATMTPSSADFGNEPVGFTTTPQVFTWKNNSTFTSGVTLLHTSGDFAATSSNCTTVASGASCQISVTFSPTTLGALTGILSVGSGAQTLTATLTGTGTPGLSLAPANVTYGSVDISATQTLSLTVTNNAPGGLPLPSLVTTGDYSATTNCASTVPANSTCQLFVTFKPTASGTRNGTVSLNAGYAILTSNLVGNGIDFSIALAPTSGTVIAGRSVTTVATLTPIAGYTGNLSITCTTSAPGAACSGGVNYALTGTASFTLTMTTTAQYKVIGYGGVAQGWTLSLLALGSVGLLWFARKRTGGLVRASLMVLTLAAGSFFLTGCSGKLPESNSTYTGPGDYTFTVTATDGTITHSATYGLHVTVN